MRPGGMTPCWDELKRREETSQPLVGAEKPNCDRTGRYHPKQCKVGTNTASESQTTCLV